MTNSVEAAIDFLTNRKFGLVASIVNGLGSLPNNERNVLSEQKAKIEEFKATLRNMDKNELLTLHKRSLAIEAEQALQRTLQEERDRFYNQPAANADYVHWSKAAHWTVDEAVALSFGKDPDFVTWKKIEPLKEKSAFAKAFSKRRDLALRATRWKKFHDLIPPVTFVSWAKEIKIDLPQELICEVEKIGGLCINWHEQYQKLKAEIAANKITSKPESTRKSENLLQALTSVAVDAYGYDPQSAKSTAPQDIADALAKRGKKVDPKTIRTWLKEGNELLPQNR
ncbi:hypothetical protein [Methylicorpusculum sp.]|uniref:hypothetical protein n=1 Tax=Methylicorpusculum sp. TaxID=2713644 RepID=UPI002AB836C0|nr:hypothetical protein [Methylicorpusculum sp.]MDZ4150748.1 hypothetical protein [Methylicorpusculum sp.]